MSSNSIYNEEGKISQICLQAGYESGHGYAYYIYNVSRMSNDHTNEEVAEMIKNGDIRASIVRSYATFFMAYDWQNATFEYKGQQSSQEEEQTAEAASFETTNEQGEVDGFDWNAYRARMQQKEEEEQKNYAQQIGRAHV